MKHGLGFTKMDTDSILDTTNTHLIHFLMYLLYNLN